MEKEVIRIAYKYIILLLIAALLCTGTVFSRYASQNSYSSEMSIGAFRYSYTVGVDETQFTTNAYYADDNTTSSGAAVRYIEFTLDGSDSDVNAQSTFTFSSDYSFMQNIAFQIVEEETNGETAVTPQYVMSSLLEATNGTSVDTSSFSSYGEVSGATEQTLSVTTGNSSFTATATDGTSISLSTNSTSHSITYMYGRGEVTTVTETVTSTDGSGSVSTYEIQTDVNSYNAPEVYVEYGVDAGLSNLTISLPQFLISAGKTRTFRFYFTTVSSTKLDAASAYNSTHTSITGATGLYYNVENVTYYTDSGAENAASDTITVKVVETISNNIITTAYYNVTGGGDVELTSISGTIYGNDGVYIDTSKGSFAIASNYDGTKDYTVDESAMGVLYGMSIGITFEQASELPQ